MFYSYYPITLFIYLLSYLSPLLILSTLSIKLSPYFFYLLTSSISLLLLSPYFFYLSPHFFFCYYSAERSEAVRRAGGEADLRAERADRSEWNERVAD
jgi:hypothetical protein